MPINIDPIQVQSNFPVEKKPSLDPEQKAIYNDVFSLQNAFRILFLVLDNTFTKIQDHINGLVEGIPEAPIDGQLYGRKDAAWEVAAAGAGSAVFIPGAFYGFLPNYLAASTANNAVGSNLISVQLAQINGTGTFKIGLNITTYSAGMTFRIGLYNLRSSTWLPGTLHVDCGSIVITTAGLKYTPDFEVDVPGIYALVVFFPSAGSGNIQQRTYTGVAFPDGVPSTHLGAGTPPTRSYAALTHPVGTLPDLTTQAFTTQSGAQSISGAIWLAS
jgi:hypothetical protein